MTPKEKREDPLLGVRCQATNRRKVRCRKAVVPGLAVCEFHGGGSMKARHAGQARLEALVPRAVRRMKQLMDQRQHLPTALGATKDILDRGGLKPVERAEANVTYKWLDDEEPEAPPATPGG